MAELERPAALSDPLLVCCICRSLLQRSVLLSCLHSCCQRCFSSAALKSSIRDVKCSACGEITHTGGQQPNRFLDLQVKRYRAMTECRTCDTCQENGDADELAVMWCTECQRSLCGGCLSEHKTHFSSHSAQLFEQLEDLDAMCLQSPAPTCTVHSRPLEIACLNCKMVKCLSCWIECHKNRHEMHVLGDHSSEDYLEKLITSISSMEKTLLQKSVVLEKPRSVVSALKAARADHLKQIEQRKRRIVDAVEEAYQEIEYSTKNAYDDLEKEADDAAAAAERIELNLAGARDYVQRLLHSHSQCDIFDQQKVVQDRLTSLSVELDKLSTLISASRNFTIESTLSENFEHLVKSWIGVPQLHTGQSSPAPSCPPPDGAVLPLQAQASSVVNSVRMPSSPPRPLPTFDKLGSVELGVCCSDLVPTNDGRLLLAAGQDGLIELSSSGEELSRWQPPSGPAPPDGGDGWLGRDSVLAVAALSSGHVAVALHWSRVVVVLQRQGRRSSQSKVDDTWVEVHRLGQLRWRPQRLSVHGDVLAVAGCLRWGTLLLAEGSEQVRLANSAGRVWLKKWESDDELSLGYRTAGLAVTPRAVVSASRDPVQLGGGRLAQVVDAHSRSFDKRRWRRGDLCEDDEVIKDVCADCAAGVLYAALFRGDESGGRLAVLSLRDGSTLRRVALTFRGRPQQQQPSPHSGFPWPLPQRLSLSDEVTQQQLRSTTGPWCVLTVLYDGSWSGQTVTMHRRIVK